MSAQFHAWLAAVGGVGKRYSIWTLGIRTGALAVAVTAAGCTPETTRMASADPANPAVRVAGTRYRSTIAPYTSLRPSAPAPWRERNESVAPKPRRDQP